MIKNYSPFQNSWLKENSMHVNPTNLISMPMSLINEASSSISNTNQSTKVIQPANASYLAD